MRDSIEGIILRKADIEYDKLKVEISDWENYFLQSNNLSRNILMSDNKYSRRLDAMKTEIFGERLKRVLKMYFFSDGFIELGDFDTKPAPSLELVSRIKK